MTERLRIRLRIVAWFAVLGTLGGALYGLANSDGEWLGLARGAASGFLIATPLVTFEALFTLTPAGDRLERLPFIALMAVRTAIYLAVILVGSELAAFAVGFDTYGGLVRGWALFWSIIFGGAFSIIANFIMEIDAMLGQGELLRFIRGRYHRPREEERIFLFLDLVGSTAIAERIGGVRFLELLDRLYHDIAVPIVEHRGQIHKYVGDEMIVTWTLERGLKDGRPVACTLAILDAVAAAAARYTSAFGTAPAFRCGLHLGPVVTGEIGSVKREIVYVGDTVNTAARLIEACRAEGRSCIATGALLDRLALPHGTRADPLGLVRLRGKKTALPLFALSRESARKVAPAAE